jgi:hypothetical protein
MIAQGQTPERQRLAVGQYRSAICACGGAKKPGQSFCNACWHALPHALQRPLVASYGTRYELAYFAAAEWLAQRFTRKESA